MSNRAYRINKIEKEDAPTFNLSSLDDTIYDELMTDRLIEGVGFIEVSAERLKEILADPDFAPKIQDFEREAFLSDIKWAEEHNEPYIQWLCV